MFKSRNANSDYNSAQKIKIISNNISEDNKMITKLNIPKESRNNGINQGLKKRLQASTSFNIINNFKDIDISKMPLDDYKTIKKIGVTADSSINNGISRNTKVI